MPHHWIFLSICILFTFSHSVSARCLAMPDNAYHAPADLIHHYVPFRPGEVATYEMDYGGITVGKASVSVRNPQFYQGIWHWNFFAELHTASWYDNFFYLHDTMEALTVPNDFRITRFHFDRDEEEMFKPRKKEKKRLDFDHERCRVKESRFGKNYLINKEIPLEPSAKGALSVFFFLRTLTYEIGVPIRTVVFSSAKNWSLIATPIAFETLETAAGTYKTVKLEVLTKLGGQLRQKGRGWVWIALEYPYPMVRIEGEVKLGSLAFELIDYRAGEEK